MAEPRGSTSPEVVPHHETYDNAPVADKEDISHVERTLTTDLDKKDHMDYDRVDAEVQKYTSDVRYVSPMIVLLS
jgi:hypothetical protein